MPTSTSFQFLENNGFPPGNMMTYLGLILLLSTVSSADPLAANAANEVRNCNPGTFWCPHNPPTCCRLEDQVCSKQHTECTDLFTLEQNKDDRTERCCRSFLHESESEEGLRQACTYLLGLYNWEATCKDSQITDKGSLSTRSPTIDTTVRGGNCDGIQVATLVFVIAVTVIVTPFMVFQCIKFGKDIKKRVKGYLACQTDDRTDGAGRDTPPADKGTKNDDGAGRDTPPADKGTKNDDGDETQSSAPDGARMGFLTKTE